MIIQHNIPALNAHRQLSTNNSQVAKSLEKLSSGYRINKAGDDAAGLAISEKMRGQISGLNQASRNAQDGISLIQTGEGALQETHSILQRMRELAVQSSNGTYDNSNDRYNIDKEVQALKTEVDRISSSTDFNGRKLLDGTMSGAEIAGHGALQVGDKAPSEIFTFDTTANAKKTLDAGIQIKGDDGKAVTITFAAAAATGDANENTATAAWSGSTLTITTTSGYGAAAEAGAISASVINAAISKATGTAVSNVGITFTKDGTTDASGALTAGGQALTGSLARATSIAKDATITAANIGAATGSTTATEIGASDPIGQLVLQIGANGASDQRVSLSVADMSSKGLGVDAIDLTTRVTANDAVSKVDTAINKVSSTRADLGALQNRLDHTINNLGVSKENLTAAESRIRDVDMASEMMTYTKNNILTQAAQAMLAQANTLPQGVLQLLG